MHHHFLVFLTRFVLCLRMQARNIFIIVLVGVFHAFLLLPIALATFGDDPVAGAAHSGVQIKQVQLGVDKPPPAAHEADDHDQTLGINSPHRPADGSEPSTPPEGPPDVGLFRDELTSFPADAAPPAAPASAWAP